MPAEIATAEFLVPAIAAAGTAVAAGMAGRRTAAGISIPAPIPSPKPGPAPSPIPRRVEVDVAAAEKEERDLAARRRGRTRSLLTRGVDFGRARTQQGELLGL